MSLALFESEVDLVAGLITGLGSRATGMKKVSGSFDAASLGIKMCELRLLR